MTMARGKETCRILKEIRKKIAEANDIEFVTSECRYNGDCLGTCPKCEAEVRYLEQQLRSRSLAGKAVVLAGISATVLAMSMPMATSAQTLQDSTAFITDSVPVAATDTFTLKGVVWGEEVLPDGTVSKAPLVAACISSHLAGHVFTDLHGEFSLSVCIGDSLEIKYIGYETQKIAVTEAMKHVTVTLTLSQGLLGEVAVVGNPPEKEKHYLDLHIFDESGNRIDRNNLEVARVWVDSDGEDNYEILSQIYVDEKHPCRIYWNYEFGLKDERNKPIKEATISITADGYEEPAIIKVKYPKRPSKETVVFKHKKHK